MFQRSIFSATLLALLGIFYVQTNVAVAQTLTWDGDPGSAGIQEATADWLGTNVWFNGASNVNWINGADALVGTQGPGQIGRGNSGLASLNSLTFDATIGAGNTYRIETNRGDRPLTFVGDAEINVPVGVIAQIEPGPSGNATIEIQGGGTVVWSERDPVSFTGGIAILNGTLSSQAKINYMGQFGQLTFLDTSGNADATLVLGGNPPSAYEVANNIVVQSGSTGTALIQYSDSTGGLSTGTFSGNITLGRDLNFDRSGTQQNAIELTGDISGPAGLNFDITGFPNNHSVTLSGDNTYEGTTSVTGSNAGSSLFAVNGTQGNSNFVIDDVTMNGTGTLVFNVDNDVSDLIALIGNGAIDLTGFTLAPSFSGTQTLEEFAIIDQIGGVTGTFANTSGFTVDYDGTIDNPNAVVLLAPIQNNNVPEPASLAIWALLLLPVLAGARVWRHGL